MRNKLLKRAAAFSAAIAMIMNITLPELSEFDLAITKVPVISADDDSFDYIDAEFALSHVKSSDNFDFANKRIIINSIDDLIILSNVNPSLYSECSITIAYAASGDNQKINLVDEIEIYDIENDEYSYLSFQGFGSAACPFRGEINYNKGTEDYGFIVNKPLFDYIYDSASVCKNEENGLKFEAGCSEIIFADHVVHDAERSSSDWKIYLSCDGYIGGLINIIGENSKVDLSVKNNPVNDQNESSSLSVSSEENAGLFCRTMEENSVLKISKYSENGKSEFNVNVSCYGNAGAFVGEMYSGSRLIVSENITVASDINGDNAGGIIGKAENIAYIDSDINVTVTGSVIGNETAGGFIGMYDWSEFLDSPYNNGFNLNQIKISGVSLTSVYSGGFIGIMNNLDESGRSFTLLGNANISSKKTNSFYYGGIIGRYSSSSHESELKICGGGAAPLTVSSATDSDITVFGGVIGCMEDYPYVYISDVEVKNDRKDKVFQSYGGIIGSIEREGSACIKNVSVHVYSNGEISGYKLRESAPVAAGAVVGYSSSGVIKLSGTTDLTDAYPEEEKSIYGQIAGIRNDTLIYADDSWKLKRSSVKKKVSDIGDWGEVLRAAELNEIISFNSSSHEFLVKNSYDESGKIKDIKELICCALELQFDGNSVLSFEKQKKYDIYSQNTIEIINDIDLKGTGLTGITRDDAGCSFSGIISGNNKTVSLSVGEIYGTRDGNTIENNDVGSGQIYSHSHNGLINLADSLKVDKLNVSGTMNCFYNNKNYYAGALAGESFGNTEVSNVNSQTLINYAEGASAGGFFGQARGTNSFNTCIRKQDMKYSSSATSPAVYAGGYIGRYFNAKNTQNELTVSECSMSDYKVNTPSGTNVFIAGFIGVVDDAVAGGSDNTIKINGLTVDKVELQSGATASVGGLLGYSWSDIDMEASGIEIKNSTLTAASASSGFGGLIYAASGYMEIKKGKKDFGIKFSGKNNFSGKSTKEKTSGLIVGKANGVKGIDSASETYGSAKALFLNISDNYKECFIVDNDSVVLNIGGSEYFDEIAGASERTGEQGGNGIISISNGAVLIDQTNCDTYIQQINDSKKYKNGNTRYYYNTGRSDEHAGGADKVINTGKEFLVWSMYQYAQPNIRKYIAKDISFTISGNIDLRGISYYPVDFSGNVRFEDAVIVFSNKDINEVEKNNNNKFLSDKESQHYLMHTGIFENVMAEESGDTLIMIDKPDGIKLKGTIGKSETGAGALVSGKANGLVTGLSNKKCIIMVADGSKISLDNLTVTDFNKDNDNYTPLLINKIGNYTNLTINGIEAVNYSSSVKAATSLIGDAGDTETGRFINIYFKNADLNGKKDESIFTRATFLNSYSYSEASTCSGQYTFSDTDAVTYGKEISNTEETGGRNQNNQDHYFNNKNKAVTATIRINSFFEGDVYLRYVFVPEKPSERHYELDINQLSADLLNGCGTFYDPYIIKDGEQLENVAKYLSGVNVAGWRIQIDENVLASQSGTGSKEHSHTEYTYSTNWKKADGEASIANVTTYLRNAYYKIENDIDLGKSGIYSGLGGSEVSASRDEGGSFSFCGVIFGNTAEGKKPVITIHPPDDKQKNYGGLVRYGNGCVVKDLDIKYSDPIIISSDAVPADKTPLEQVFFGGVIGYALGGDNIIDNVSVDCNDIVKVEGTYDYMANVGGYVGLIGGNITEGGGVIFKNMSSSRLERVVNIRDDGTIFDITVEAMADGSIDQKDRFYWNPYVGRVLDGFSCSVNGTIDNTDKNYKVPELDANMPKLKLEGSYIDIQNEQQMWVLSAINNSGGGSMKSDGNYSSNSYAYYYGKIRTGDYSTIGESSSDSGADLDEKFWGGTGVGGAEKKSYLVSNYTVSGSESENSTFTFDMGNLEELSGTSVPNVIKVVFETPSGTSHIAYTNNKVNSVKTSYVNLAAYKGKQIKISFNTGYNIHYFVSTSDIINNNSNVITEGESSDGIIEFYVLSEWNTAFLHFVFSSNEEHNYNNKELLIKDIKNSELKIYADNECIIDYTKMTETQIKTLFDVANRYKYTLSTSGSAYNNKRYCKIIDIGEISELETISIDYTSDYNLWWFVVNKSNVNLSSNNLSGTIADLFAYSGAPANVTPTYLYSDDSGHCDIDIDPSWNNPALIVVFSKRDEYAGLTFLSEFDLNVSKAGNIIYSLNKGSFGNVLYSDDNYGVSSNKFSDLKQIPESSANIKYVNIIVPLEEKCSEIIVSNNSGVASKSYIIDSSSINLNDTYVYINFNNTKNKKTISSNIEKYEAKYMLLTCNVNNIYSNFINFYKNVRIDFSSRGSSSLNSYNGVHINISSERIDMFEYGNGFRGIGSSFQDNNEIYSDTKKAKILERSVPVSEFKGNNSKIILNRNVYEYSDDADLWWTQAVGLFPVIHFINYYNREVSVEDLTLGGELHVNYYQTEHYDKESKKIDYLGECSAGGFSGMTANGSSTSNVVLKNVKLNEIRISGTKYSGGLIGVVGKSCRNKPSTLVTVSSYVGPYTLIDCGFEDIEIEGAYSAGGLIAIYYNTESNINNLQKDCMIYGNTILKNGKIIWKKDSGLETFQITNNSSSAKQNALSGCGGIIGYYKGDIFDLNNSFKGKCVVSNCEFHGSQIAFNCDYGMGSIIGSQTVDKAVNVYNVDISDVLIMIDLDDDYKGVYVNDPSYYVTTTTGLLMGCVRNTCNLGDINIRDSAIINSGRAGAMLGNASFNGSASTIQGDCSVSGVTLYSQGASCYGGAPQLGGFSGSGGTVTIEKNASYTIDDLIVVTDGKASGFFASKSDAAKALTLANLSISNSKIVTTQNEVTNIFIGGNTDPGNKTSTEKKVDKVAGAAGLILAGASNNNKDGSSVGSKPIYGYNILFKDNIVGYYTDRENKLKDLFADSSSVTGTKNIISYYKNKLSGYITEKNVGLYIDEEKGISYAELKEKNEDYSKYKAGHLGLITGCDKEATDKDIYIEIVGLSVEGDCYPFYENGEKSGSIKGGNHINTNENNYIIRSDYTADQTNTADSKTPYVVSNPSLQNTKAVRSSGEEINLTGNAWYNTIIDEITSNTFEQNRPSQYNLPVDAISSFGISGTDNYRSAVSMYSEIGQRPGSEYTGDDFPVLVIDFNDNQKLNEMINSYISLLTDCEQVYKGTGKSAPRYRNMTVSTFQWNGEKFAEIDKPSISVVKSGESFDLVINTARFDNGNNKVTVIDVQYYNSEVPDLIYHLYIPVVLKKMIQAEFIPGSQIDAMYDASLPAYNSYGAAVASYGEKVTTLIKFRYKDGKEYWQEMINAGNDLLWNYEKKVCVGSVPAGTKLILIDRNDHDKAYSYTVPEDTSSNTMIDFRNFKPIYGGDSNAGWECVTISDLLDLKITEIPEDVDSELPETDICFIETGADEGATLRKGDRYFRIFDPSRDNVNIKKYKIETGNIVGTDYLDETYFLTLLISKEISGDKIRNNTVRYVGGTLDYLDHGIPAVISSKNSSYQYGELFSQEFSIRNDNGGDFIINQTNNTIKIKAVNNITVNSFDMYNYLSSGSIYSDIMLRMIDDTDKMFMIPSGTRVEAVFRLMKNETESLADQVSVTYDINESIGSLELKYPSDLLSYIQKCFRSVPVKDFTSTKFSICADINIIFSDYSMQQLPERTNGGQQGISVSGQSRVSYNENTLNGTSMKSASVVDSGRFYREKLTEAKLSYNAVNLDEKPASLGINGREKSRIGFNTISAMASYNVMDLSESARISAKKVRYDLSLQIKTDNGGYTDTGIDINNYIEFAEMDNVSIKRSNNMISFETDIDEACDIGSELIQFPVSFNVKTGAEFENSGFCYANYNMIIRAVLLDENGEEIHESAASDNLIYTNACVYTDFIKMAS